MTDQNNTPDEPRSQLTPEQYHITQEAGTEQAFTGKYWNEKREGTYRCIVCGEALFASDTKYDSGSGWPSFTAPVTVGVTSEHEDTSLGRVRTETRCAKCDAHLGHVFPDGPGETGLRYCINSAALDLEADETDA